MGEKQITRYSLFFPAFRHDNFVQRLAAAFRHGRDAVIARQGIAKRDDVLQALSRTGDYAQHVAGAAFAVAIVFDPGFYRGEFDSGRAVQNMMLAAWNDGLGSCIASMHREDDCKAALGVPPELRVQHIISFGYPLPVDHSIPAVPKRRRKPLDEIVRQERWKE